MSHGPDHEAEVLSDAELVALAVRPRTGTDRAEAFEMMARRHHRAVLEQCAYWLRDPDDALEVGQITFEAAFGLLMEGKPPAEPNRVRGWLIEIARRRKLGFLRKKAATPGGLSRAILPEHRAFDDLPDYEEREENRSGRALRLSRAERLVSLVVQTLDDLDRQIYDLRFQQGLSGRAVGAQLGIDAKTASNRATELQVKIAERFGALILALEGGPHCAILARILQEAHFRAAEETFTSELHERIVSHFGTCPTCDNCRTCAANRKNLIAPYAPVLILLLFSGRFLQSLREIIGQMTGQEPRGHSGPSDPPPGELTAWTQPEQLGRRHTTASGHRRARGKRRNAALAVAAGAAVVVAIAGIAIALTGHSHSAAGSREAQSSGPAPAQAAAVGAAVAVRSCGGHGATAGTVRLPAGLSLPRGAAVFDNGVVSSADTPAARYIIGQASQTCASNPNLNGTTLQSIGPFSGPGRVIAQLTPGAVNPCSASSGNAVSQAIAILAQALPCRAAASAIAPDLVTAGLRHAVSGMSAIAAWEPAGSPGYLFAPGTGDLPTYGIFAAWKPAGHNTAYDAEEIACTLPPSQLPICSAALRYFLIQVAGTGTPNAALQSALGKLDRFISQRDSTR